MQTYEERQCQRSHLVTRGALALIVHPQQTHKKTSVGLRPSGVSFRIEPNILYIKR